MKKLLTLLTTLLVVAFAYSQTNVSGGIYTNTTWTKANSPYFADSVVVFPGVTLIIEPGVVVNIANGMEVREGKIQAIGSVPDSITFIGDAFASVNHPVLFLNYAYTSVFSYCKFLNSPANSVGLGIRLNSHQDSCTVKNSVFTNNATGLSAVSTGFVYVDSCMFENNTTAIRLSPNVVSNSIIRNNLNGFVLSQKMRIQSCLIEGNTEVGIECWGDTIERCIISNNGVGVHCNSAGYYTAHIHNNIIEGDSIGILLDNSFVIDSIYCNRICNNSSHNIRNKTNFNWTIKGNYWNTNDSTIVSSSVYDGYDNSNFGLVFFMPLDTNECYAFTTAWGHVNNPIPFSLTPNPASSFLTISISEEHTGSTLTLTDLTGRMLLKSEIENSKSEISIAALPGGIYLATLTTPSGQRAVRKVVKE